MSKFKALKKIFRKREKRVGLYTTLSFHLIVLIILLAWSIRTVASQETSFVLDFTKQEILEQEQRELEFKEDISRELDNMLQSTRAEIRNVAVDAGSNLRDDRFRNPSEVYDEARELQRKLDASARDAARQKAEDEAVDMSSGNTGADDDAPAYKGPAVISYSLEGRKALLLPVPAYKGYGAGDVLVEIDVNQKGRVTGARVMTSASSGDEALYEFALDAARRSRFSASSFAPHSQQGTILYRFIAQ